MSERMIYLLLPVLVLCMWSHSASAQEEMVQLQFLSVEDSSSVSVELWVEPAGQLIRSGPEGLVRMTKDSLHQNLTTYAHGFASTSLFIEELSPDRIHRIYLSGMQAGVEVIDVFGKNSSAFVLEPMRKIEGTSIFAARKSEQLSLDRELKHTASTNLRKLFGKVAGLHIWENNDNGLQMNIGTRGLNPNRSAHFNTRQNGYDISADALGYPEAYYNPPMMAVDRLRIVRGAGALQYGTQFGGLLDFVMKTGHQKSKLTYETSQMLGSFGLVESFHSLSGGSKSMTYYSAYQYKESDGWRPNSEYVQHQAYASMSWAPFEGLDLGADISYMNYRAQLPGGLTDDDFRVDPSQSLRSRNYFRVDWWLSALHAGLRTGLRSELSWKIFHLDASREALGDLSPIHRPDPMGKRDLISGEYDNWGTELRFRQMYIVGDVPSNVVVGLRLYEGMTKNQQGFASAGDKAKFELLHPEEPEKYSYRYPGKNGALFLENVLNLSQRWTVTAGLRWEYIETNAKGYYRENIFIQDSLYDYAKHEKTKQNTRRFPLIGLGMSYRLNHQVECYGNFTQNFRSINFSDLTASNPNVVIDSNLTDEKGFTMEGGIRAQLNGGTTRFDCTVFWINYRNRIGLVNRRMEDEVYGFRSVAYRTNVGLARMLGFEGTWQQQWIGEESPGDWKLISTLNVGYIHARYIDGISGVLGNEVEYVPPYTGTLGIDCSRSAWEFSWQYKMVGGHFSDATNARDVVHATVGRIPSYQIMDASIHYEFSELRLSFFVHNILDKRYFTRRATAYPGPGIIPASPRNFSLRLQFRLGGTN